MKRVQSYILQGRKASKTTSHSKFCPLPLWRGPSVTKGTDYISEPGIWSSAGVLMCLEGPPDR